MTTTAAKSKAAAAILARPPSHYDGKISIDIAETAKLVREALKAAFPDTKFSVRIDRWSGGSGGYVKWTDGPTEKAVSEITDSYCGKGFDGSIDLSYHYDHWLSPDGTITVAHTTGTQNSMGYVPELTASAPSPDARLVTLYGSGFSTSRETSETVKAAIVEEIESYTDEAYEPNKSYPIRVFKADGGGALIALDTHESDYGSAVVWRIFALRSYGPCACPITVDTTYGCGVGKPRRCTLCGKEVC